MATPLYLHATSNTHSGLPTAEQFTFMYDRTSQRSRLVGVYTFRVHHPRVVVAASCKLA
jgi:hypothetical protein